MAKILLCSPMVDNQSGTYIHDSFIQLGHKVAFFDWRFITKEKGGQQNMNIEFLKAVDQLKPDLTLIIKGLGITGETIRKAKGIHNHKIVGWIFDVTLGGTFVKDVPPYVEFMKELDTFYTIDKSAIEELNSLGVTAKWLPEGCHIPAHKESVFNSVQKKRWGADVVFLGSVGGIHKNREKILEKLHEENIPYKIYGNVYYPPETEPIWVKDHHSGFEAVNDYHSLVCGCSKIVLGIDGWPDRDKSYSARLYRTLCAKGFYLTTHTKGIEEEFKIGEELETYKNEDELMEKLFKYLTEDELREKIAEQGQKKVIDKHQFKDSLQIMINENL